MPRPSGDAPVEQALDELLAGIPPETSELARVLIAKEDDPSAVLWIAEAAETVPFATLQAAVSATRSLPVEQRRWFLDRLVLHETGPLGPRTIEALGPALRGCRSVAQVEIAASVTGRADQEAADVLQALAFVPAEERAGAAQIVAQATAAAPTDVALAIAAMGTVDDYLKKRAALDPTRPELSRAWFRVAARLGTGRAEQILVNTLRAENPNLLAEVEFFQMQGGFGVSALKRVAFVLGLEAVRTAQREAGLTIEEAIALADPIRDLPRPGTTSTRVAESVRERLAARLDVQWLAELPSETRQAIEALDSSIVRGFGFSKDGRRVIIDAANTVGADGMRDLNLVLRHYRQGERSRLVFSLPGDTGEAREAIATMQRAQPFDRSSSADWLTGWVAVASGLSAEDRARLVPLAAALRREDLEHLTMVPREPRAEILATFAGLDQRSQDAVRKVRSSFHPDVAGGWKNPATDFAALVQLATTRPQLVHALSDRAVRDRAERSHDRRDAYLALAQIDDSVAARLASRPDLLWTARAIGDGGAAHIAEVTAALEPISPKVVRELHHALIDVAPQRRAQTIPQLAQDATKRLALAGRTEGTGGRAR